MPERFSTRRKLLFGLLALVIIGATFEVGARFLLFARNDWNPYYWTYGLVADVEDHSRARAGYTTFQPHSVKRQKRPDRLITMRINGSGFRGARDVTPKRAGVLRVATLGASSTFGYHVADDETYPAQLEAILASRSSQPVEVFNLGMPHARLDNIVALAQHELPALDPDVVTLYAGYNNAVIPDDPQDAAAAFRVKDWLHGHLVSWRYVHDLVKWVYLQALGAAPAGAVETPNLMVPLRLNTDQIDALRGRVATDFEQRLDALHAVVEARGAAFVVVSQTYLLSAVSGVQGYDTELAQIKAMLAEEGTLLAVLATRLIHAELNERTRAWAQARGVTWVDGVTPLVGVEDQAMSSQVHLSPLGNRLVAEALANGFDGAGLMANGSEPASTAVLP